MTSLSLDRRNRQLGLAGFHDERVLQRIPGGLHAVRRRLSGIMPFEIADKLACNAEYRIGFEILIVIDEDLGDQCLEALLVSQKVKMSGPIGMALLGTQHIAYGTVSGN